MVINELLKGIKRTLRRLRNIRGSGRDEPFSKEVFSELEAVKEYCRELDADIEARRVERWKATAGDYVEILTSPETALTYLEHSMPSARTAALSILSQRWGSHDEVPKRCEELTLGDPDESVRGVAAISLGECYRDTRDKRISRILATIVANEQDSKGLRRCAYLGLLIVQGIDLWAHDPTLENPQDFPVPEGIDWSIVNHSLRP